MYKIINRIILFDKLIVFNKLSLLWVINLKSFYMFIKRNELSVILILLVSVISIYMVIISLNYLEISKNINKTINSNNKIIALNHIKN